ncbi:MAG: carboxypeptidase regulatory-like domain-containing protein, partial [Acidimicrobiia bacterium]|nr:carboxypeptidase regulatory-like domain-containing protein [Acidimicrobiia bacterium]
MATLNRYLATAALATTLACTEGNGGAVAIDDDDIGGTVTSSTGPEAGVWVIAETIDLPTKFARIVTTDDQGRYLLPDLPAATYDVWVRGYGLVDSPKAQGSPGSTLDLTAVLAPDEAAAAQYYPANYWFAMLEPPPSSAFPGTGDNGLPKVAETLQHWIGDLKMTFSCAQCHQLGNTFTREIPPELGTFDTSVAAWDHRLQAGMSGSGMYGTLVGKLGKERGLDIFADWTDRIADGELPPEKPPRPQGRERNVVLTLWDWAEPTLFVHDEISTDKRNPTLNANGPVYGVTEHSGDWLTVLDPNTHTASKIAIPPAPDSPEDPLVPLKVPSPYWGTEDIWSRRVVAHNPMMDELGRVWSTARDHCRMYEPSTGEWTIVEGCVARHHLQFAEDEDRTLLSNSPPTWFKTKVWEETGDAEAAFGQFPLILDSNANGRQDEGDTVLRTGFLYAVIPNPTDGSIWWAEMANPGSIIRVDPGSNPPETALAEYYQPPFYNDKTDQLGHTPHGIDIDRNGVIWVSLTGSGHLGSFDRRKCTGPLNGPDAVSGQHCPEGWTLHLAPGPAFKGVDYEMSADSFYYNWVDQFDTFGMGENVPFLNGTGS